MDYEIKDFQTDVIEKSFEKPVLVDFWAEWCGPCRIISPILEKLAEQNKESWQLAKVDTDKNQETASSYGVRGIPNVKLFKDGKVINEFTGALPESQIVDWLAKSIPGKFAAQIEKAKNLLIHGNAADAKVILEEVLNGDINNIEVKILLAKILLFDDTKESLRLIESAGDNFEYQEIVDSIKIISDLILRDRNSFADSEIKEKYLSAIEDLKKKNFDSSLEKFINIIRDDRSYDDDGARKACIAIFKYLGEDNEITIKHRRDFGSALYI